MTSVRRHRFAPATVLRFVVLVAFAVYFLVPLIWLLLAPTKTDAGLVHDAPLSFGSLGNVADAWNHLMSYNDAVILRWALNSLIYSLGSLLLTAVTSVMAGYALAVLRVPFRRTILMLTLIAMLVPPTALVLPLFLEVNALHLVDTMWSVILPASFFPFGTYLAYIYFSTSLPVELLEAARLDGCSEVGLFTRIAIPLAKPVVGLIAFFAFVANWNNYFLPFVMLNSEDKFNLPLGLGVLISGAQALFPSSNGGSLPIHRPEVALAGLIVVLPIAVVFIFCQRFLVRGILAGSVKS